MLSHRLPLLITGAAGVAGFNAFHALQRKYSGQVIGIRPRQTWKLVAPGILAQDAKDADEMRSLFDRFGFRSVLNCVGNCALKSCELDPAMAHTVNVQSAQVIAEASRRHGARLVHLSSDLVFSGTRAGNHVESDPTDPVTVYGKTMVQAEEILQAKTPDAAILRISLPMGPSFNRHAGAIDWIQSRFRAHRPATLYFDEVRSCTYCSDLTDVCEKFLSGNASGIFHCGGPEPITLYQIAQVVNRVGDYRPELLKGCPRIEAGPIPPRAGDVSMSSARLIAELGAQPFERWPAGDDLVPGGRDWHFDRPADETRSVVEIGRRLYQKQKALTRFNEGFCESEK
ncbi:MAG: sugar nucleotide-binding protein [Planctomycetes bacterium]|nr:sugar nucleotide-binding protein [Planctomycetota bacterium]